VGVGASFEVECFGDKGCVNVMVRCLCVELRGRSGITYINNRQATFQLEAAIGLDNLLRKLRSFALPLTTDPLYYCPR
jgi:hypothetical protein